MRKRRGQPQKAKNPSTSGGNEPSSNNREYRAIVRAIEALPEKINTKQKQDDPYKKKSFFWNRLTSWFVGSYTLFTAGLFILSKCSLDWTVDASIAAQRAYITFSAPSFDTIQGNKEWKISLSMENSGNSSTRNLTFNPGLWYENLALPIQGGNPDAQEWKLANGKGAESRYSIGPKEKIVVGPYVIDEKTIRSMQNKEISIYIIGNAFYSDIFPDTPEHRTKFCFKILPTTGNPGNTEMYSTRGAEIFPEIAEPSSRPCFRNNCTDKECNEREAQPAPQKK